MFVFLPLIPAEVLLSINTSSLSSLDDSSLCLSCAVSVKFAKPHFLIMGNFNWLFKCTFCPQISLKLPHSSHISSMVFSEFFWQSPSLLYVYLRGNYSELTAILEVWYYIVVQLFFFICFSALNNTAISGMVHLLYISRQNSKKGGVCNVISPHLESRLQSLSQRRDVAILHLF